MDMRHNAPFSKIEPAGRRGQWRRGFLLAAVAVLALAASLVMTPAPAEAQSNVTLVSNKGLGGLQCSTLVAVIPNLPAPSPPVRPAAATDWLQSPFVWVPLVVPRRWTSPSTATATELPARGCSPSKLRRAPTWGVSELTLLSALRRVRRLTANTTYWVVAGTTSGAFRLTVTNSDDELSGKQPGWSIGNDHASMSGPDASWVTDSARSLQMAVQGVVVDSFVSNLGLAGLSEAAVGRFGNLTATAAFSFTTGTNRGGYRLTSVTLRLRRGDDTLEGDAVPVVKIYRDSDGVPGSEFFRLSHLGNIGDMPQSYTNRTFYPATNADTRLPPNRTYWVVATGTRSNGRLYWLNTRSSASAEQAGWSIPNGFLQGGTPWRSND